MDLTPRPAYVALAAVGRWLAGARALGRWQPLPEVHVYAFGARPDGVARDVLVIWTEKEADWDDRGRTTSNWQLPAHLTVQKVSDHLGRTVELPPRLGSAPIFIVLPAGQATTLPLEAPLHPLPAPADLAASPVVLQLGLAAPAVVRVEDAPWSEGYAYGLAQGQEHSLPIRIYNFSTDPTQVRLSTSAVPADWRARIAGESFEIEPHGRREASMVLEIPNGTRTRDGWVTLENNPGGPGRATLAFRVRVREE